MFIQYYDSPLGKMLLAADEIGLIGVWFENQKYYANGLKEPIEEETAVLKETKEWLNLYFKGKDTFNKLGYKAKINTHTTSYIN